WGRRSFWCWFIGFHLAFMPLYVVGLMGMTRRLQHYDVLAWQPWLLVAEAGAVVILAGIVCQIVQLVVSIRGREALCDVTGDPWYARMVGRVAAAGLELCRPSPGRRVGRLLERQAARARRAS